MCSALALVPQRFNAQILFQIAEEDFNLPAFSIDLREGVEPKLRWLLNSTRTS